MSDFLLDTDVLIEVLRGNPGVLKSLEGLFGEGHVFLYSPVTRAEIFQGMRKGEEEKTNRLFQTMRCVPVDDEIGKIAGLYLRKFRKSHGLQLGDSLLAATARSTKAGFYTLNVRHYPMADIRIWKEDYLS
ncbi:MAG: type II toxin-antitoxin system VapC family toxin [Armatimonadetes bacterium]|nr:type II toxin-antitoxin system VapC family toxin [Armatimonadota bacterium]